MSGLVRMKGRNPQQPFYLVVRCRGVPEACCRPVTLRRHLSTGLPCFRDRLAARCGTALTDRGSCHPEQPGRHALLYSRSSADCKGSFCCWRRPQSRHAPGYGRGWSQRADRLVTMGLLARCLMLAAMLRSQRSRPDAPDRAACERCLENSTSVQANSSASGRRQPVADGAKSG